MVLDLSPVINADGKRLNFEKRLDFCGKREQGAVFLTPICVSGELRCIGGSIELTATASVRLELVCDRCCEPFEVDFACSFEELLKKEDDRATEDKNPDAVYFRGNGVELDELVLTNIALSLPLKRLCREDCRGLCAGCGKNLNLGSCGCDTRPSDPRFDILDKFFE